MTDEIIVRGVPPAYMDPWGFRTVYPTGGPMNPPPPPAPSGGSGTRPPPAKPKPAPPPAPPEAFLPPVAAPKPIEQIVVTAKRRASVRIVATRALAAGSWLLSGAFAVASLEQYRRRLEFEADEASKRDSEKRRARRLARETVQTAAMPEIIVTAKRPAAFAPYVLPPMPDFIPWGDTPDPFIMQPIIPRQLPQRPARVDVEVSPPEIPTRAPTRREIRLPTRLPEIRPGTLPGTRPAIRPGTAPKVAPSPLVAPGPAVAPAPAAAPAPSVAPSTNLASSTLANLSRLTSLNRRMATSRRSDLKAQAQAQAQRAQNTRKCKPCKKEKDKPRNECWRVLVKEARYPRDDEKYPWVPIDCDTGREIKGPVIWR